MFVRETSFCAVVAMGVLTAGPIRPALAQSETPAPGSREHVQSLLDQYAPGTVQLDSLPLPATAFRTTAASAGVALPPTVANGGLPASYAAPAANAAEACARAQAFLNQYSPGMVTLGEQGVRVEIPGAAVVDTRAGTTTVTKHGAAPTGTASATALHRAAVDEAVRSLQSGRYRQAGLWLAAVSSDLPRDADLRQLESLALVGDGRYAEAAEVARIGLILAPAWTAERLKSVLPAADDLDKTLQQQVLHSNPDPRTLFLAAYYDLMLGRRAEASRLFERADQSLPPGWITDEIRSRFATE
jgi:tetratricopeptide (TPR) repeat protein